jgi:hypothetical protein
VQKTSASRTGASHRERFPVECGKQEVRKTDQNAGFANEALK